MTFSARKPSVAHNFLLKEDLLEQKALKILHNLVLNYLFSLISPLYHPYLILQTNLTIPGPDHVPHFPTSVLKGSAFTPSVDSSGLNSDTLFRRQSDRMCIKIINVILYP